MGDACGRPCVCSTESRMMSEPSIPALGRQPRFPAARGDVSLLRCSELAQSSCSVLESFLPNCRACCFDQVLFGGIIHRSCCGITRFTEPNFFCGCASCAAAVVALACLRRSSVWLAQPFSAHHWKCSFSLQELQSVVEVSPASSVPKRRSRGTWLSLG